MSESNKMKEMPVNRLMVQMGIPMILSMALQAVYNIVDSAFVGNMKVGSEAALNALERVSEPMRFSQGHSDREMQKKLQKWRATVYFSEKLFMWYVSYLEFLE